MVLGGGPYPGTDLASRSGPGLASAPWDGAVAVPRVPRPPLGGVSGPEMLPSILAKAAAGRVGVATACTACPALTGGAGFGSTLLGSCVPAAVLRSLLVPMLWARLSQRIASNVATTSKGSMLHRSAWCWWWSLRSFWSASMVAVTSTCDTTYHHTGPGYRPTGSRKRAMTTS